MLECFYMKKITQKNKEEKTYKSGEVMSMLEHINDGIEIISEQHGEVVKRLDNLEVKVDNLEVKVDNLEVKFNNLEVKVDSMQEDVTEIKHKLSEKVDREEFNRLEKRFLKVERLVLTKKFV